MASTDNDKFTESTLGPDQSCIIHTPDFIGLIKRDIFVNKREHRSQTHVSAISGVTLIYFQPYDQS